MSDAPEPTPVADLSYEDAREELVQLVSRIESGQVPLEESMVLWERGEELAAHCQAKLDAAQETLDRATHSPGGAAEADELEGAGHGDEVSGDQVMGDEVSDEGGNSDAVTSHDG